MPNHLLDSALAYLRLGWNPIPLCPGNHFYVGREHLDRCKKPGKSPLFSWKHLQTRRLTEAEVRRYWEKLPNANVGVVLGEVSGGLVGVDVDGDRQYLRQLSQNNLPKTLEFSTARGCRLLYLDRSRLIRNRTWTSGRNQVSVLAGGKLTVMPPSVHQDGSVYRWRRRQLEVADAPLWLSQLQETPIADGVERGAGPIAEGARNATLFRMGCAMRRWGAQEPELTAAIRLTNQRCVPPLDDADVCTIVRSCCRYLPAV